MNSRSHEVIISQLNSNPVEATSTDHRTLKNLMESGAMKKVQSGDGELVFLEHSLFLRLLKRTIDVFGAITILILFGWLYIFLWVCVFLTSGRPVIYQQPRVGRGGRLFKFYKFRSMVSDADAVLSDYLARNPLEKKQWDEFQKLDFDPRVTRFGLFIRKASLDEFPQFWNVLIGDMSLVGPRPCMPQQCERYGASWPYYCAVRPGITGLWQVSGRNRLNYSSRISLDVQYVKELSILGDALIMVKTLYVVAVGHGSS